MASGRVVRSFEIQVQRQQMGKRMALRRRVQLCQIFGKKNLLCNYSSMVGWRSCLTQCRMVTEVKHGRARSGVGWVTAQVIDQ